MICYSLTLSKTPHIETGPHVLCSNGTEYIIPFCDAETLRTRYSPITTNNKPRGNSLFWCYKEFYSYVNTNPKVFFTEGERMKLIEIKINCKVFFLFSFILSFSFLSSLISFSLSLYSWEDESHQVMWGRVKSRPLFSGWSSPWRKVII